MEEKVVVGKGDKTTESAQPDEPPPPPPPPRWKVASSCREEKESAIIISFRGHFGHGKCILWGISSKFITSGSVSQPTFFF